MSSKIVETLAPGIYRTESGGFRVRVSVGDRKNGGHQRETTFKKGTALRQMQSWQTQHRAALERSELRVVRGEFETDAKRYLALADITKLAGYKTRVGEIAAWYPKLGKTMRHLVTPKQISDQMEQWRNDGLAAWTRIHRLKVLRHLYSKLDGQNAPNPAREVPLPKKPKAVPRALPYDVIRASLATMRPTATKAFLTIMAFCGFRPEEIRCIEPHMIHLDATVADESTGKLVPAPFVVRPSVKGGDVVAVYLPEEGVEGWRLWLAENAWNSAESEWEMDSFSNANRDWQKAMMRVRAERLRNGQIQDAARYDPVPCYALVHSYCTQLHVEGQADITVVQKARGHREVRTTQIYTTMRVDPRITDAVKRAFRRPEDKPEASTSRG